MKPEEILIVLGMMAVTFGVRYPVLALAGRVNFPPAIVRALKYVPPTVLTAIVMPDVLFPGSHLRLELTSPYVLGAVIAAVMAWRTKNLLLTIIVSMAAFFLLRSIFGA